MTDHMSEPKANSDKTSKDNDADKTGTDSNSDKTKTPGKNKSKKGKFDKPSRETDPDRTGIDTKSDKTKKETAPSKESSEKSSSTKINNTHNK